MYKVRKAIFKVFMVVLCAFATISVPTVNTSIAEAAVKSPALSETSKTIIAGGDPYLIKLVNVSKKVKVTYKSEDTFVATVDKNGKVTGKREGDSKVTVKVVDNSKTYQLSMNIKVIKGKFEFVEYVDYLNVAETFSFKATAVGSKEKVTYSVSDPAIATIDSNGVLRAVGAGVVTIYATSGESETSCKVTIGTNILGTLFKEVTIFEDKTIYITVKNSTDYKKMSYDCSDSDVISCKWGEWVDNRSPLTIKPVGVGTTTLIISTDDKKEKLYIKVNVIKAPTKKELSAKELYAQCGVSTVEIIAKDGSDSSQGSGFFLSENIVVTNYHVIAGASKIIVTSKDESAHEVMTILGYDEKLDLALLKVEGKGHTPLELASENASVGETIYALGSPLGLTGTMTSGMISTDNRNIEGVDYIQITAPLSAGNSGGPLLNVYGEVIGVNTMYYVDGQNLNFAINIQELQKINTNNPILVEDYYKNYYDKLVADLEANSIQEDPTKSQSAETCQEIPSMTYVNGLVTAAEGGDLYRFTIKEPGWYYGMAKFEVFDDYKNTYFDLYDSNIDFIVGCKEDDEKLILSTKYYLNPGDYYIYVCVDKNYNGTPIPYGFVLVYY